ncbi:MAG: 50S ribosomal protein L22 [Gaiellales bacterium]
MAEATPTEVTCVRAQARFVRGSARKARVVLDHIRGKSVVQARAALAFTPRAAARDILAALESAAANAENNHDLEPNELRIEEAYADEGPTLKRWQPRARGRAMRIRKRSCHLTIVLKHDPKLAEAAAATGTRRGSAAQATIEATKRARRTGKAAPESVAETTDAPVASDAPAPKKRRAKAAAPAEAAAVVDDTTTEAAEAAPAEVPADEAPAAAEGVQDAPASEVASDETTPKEEEV